MKVRRCDGHARSFIQTTCHARGAACPSHALGMERSKTGLLKLRKKLYRGLSRTIGLRLQDGTLVLLFAIEQWRSIALSTIPAEQLSPAPRAWLDQEQRQALGLVMHVRYGSCIFTSNWHHPGQFLGVYNLWVARVAHTHWGFRAL